MMKTKLKFTFYFIAILLLGLSSCKKEELSDDPSSLGLSLDNEASVNEVRTVLAQTLAKALQDDQLRAYFHEKMQEVYQSNYEWVYLAEKDNIIYDNKKLTTILKEYAGTEILNQYGDNFFEVLTEISPLLAVSMPDWETFNASTWDKNFVPNVVSVLDGPNSTYAYTMYKQNGESKNYQPEDIETIKDPVLSVWDAEAYYLIGKDGITSFGHHIDHFMPSTAENKDCFKEIEPLINRFPSFVVNQKSFNLIGHNSILELYYNCLGMRVEEETISPRGSMCDRDPESLDERLAQFKINNWGVFDNIRNQAFESKYVFHGDVLYGVLNSSGGASPATVKYVSPEFKKGDILNCPSGQSCSGKWKAPSYRIWTDWDQSEFGSPYYISWAEVDNGTTTLSLSFPTVFKFKPTDTTELSLSATVGYSRVGSAIVSLGSQAVFYCDPIMMSNNTGSVTFQCN